MTSLIPKKVEEFLRQSNAIEREYSEEAYQDSVIAWNYLMGESKLTPDVILKTHKLLMKSRNTIPNAFKARYRNCPVYIGGHEGMDHTMIATAIEKRFCYKTMQIKPDWKNLHILYEKIHPFMDGNGRTGRMFMNWTRVKRLGLPLLVIHEGEEQMKYYKWFEIKTRI